MLGLVDFESQFIDPNNLWSRILRCACSVGVAVGSVGIESIGYPLQYGVRRSDTASLSRPACCCKVSTKASCDSLVETWPSE